MKLTDIVFPVFILPRDIDIDTQDGIVFANRQMLDDLNVNHDSLGMRRLRSSYPTKFPLTKAVHDIPSFLKSAAKRFVDSNGTVFRYDKTRMVDLRYYLIKSVRRLGTKSIVWIEDINFPFDLARPPDPEMRWAGILYDGRHPWLLYEFSENKKKDTKRKI